jgi:hypothetical protein
MPLPDELVVAQVKEMLSRHESERNQLDDVRRYWKGLQRLPAIVPASAPREVREMAKIARINICEIVVDSLAQSLFVDGFRVPRQAENLAVWDVWQANRFDREQAGVHRAAVAYGAAYVVVLPGVEESRPAMRGVSPRRMHALYGDDPDWAVWALERLGEHEYRLYDTDAVYTVARETGSAQPFAEMPLQVVGEPFEHGMGQVPVVRFRDQIDLDDDDEVDGIDHARLTLGQVAPRQPLQDQMDITTFGLLVAQHYSAFRQRWILGWVAESEEQQMKAAAAQIWTFDDHPEDVKLGEFSETTLKGYIDSRQETARFAATLSQTPVHELIGQLVNMSAEALAAAEAGKDRKVDERKTGFGESWEQTLSLVGGLIDEEVPDGSEVVWRDTSARAFAAVVDGLGKLAQMLGIPVEELWEKVPGATQQDVERWKAARAEGDAFAQMNQLLERQAAPEVQPSTNGTQPAAVVG